MVTSSPPMGPMASNSASLLIVHSESSLNESRSAFQWSELFSSRFLKQENYHLNEKVKTSPSSNRPSAASLQNIAKLGIRVCHCLLYFSQELCKLYNITFNLQNCLAEKFSDFYCVHLKRIGIPYNLNVSTTTGSFKKDLHFQEPLRLLRHLLTFTMFLRTSVLHIEMHFSTVSQI